MQFKDLKCMLQSIMQYSKGFYMILLILIHVMNILKNVLIFVIPDKLMKNECNVYVAYVIIMLIIIT